MDFEMIVSPPDSTSTPSQATRDGLQQWLNGAQLPEYLDAFLAEGFDLELLCTHGLNEGDLVAMGITKRGHIKLLLAAAEELKNPLSHRRLLRRIGEDSDPSKPASTPEFKQLLDFSARNMMLSIDQERACTYLEVACKYGDETLKAVCLDFIEKNAVAVLSSQDFLKAGQPTLELILQCPNLDVDEILLFQALLRWKGAVALRDLTPLGKLIRFGAIQPKDLLEIVEPAGVATSEQLLAAYRYHATPGFAPSLATNPFFCNRKKATDPKPLDLSRNPETQNIFPIPVRGSAWKMTMSTTYPGLPNNYETLTDDKPCFPGCATNYGSNQWVQATFDRPVLVNKVKLSAPNQGEFIAQGWGDSYLVGTEIQISTDEKNWETVARCDKANSTGFTEVPLQQSKMARFWRLFKPTGYIATGSLIFE